MAAGAVSWTLIDMKRLAPALRLLDAVDKIGISELTKRVEKLDVDQLIALKETGCVCQHVTQAASETLSVPAGWLCAEVASPGVLVRGVRRSFIPAGDVTLEAYEELMGTHVVEDRPLTKMKEVAELMKA